MPPPQGRDSRRLTRADLPAELTAETLRGLGFRTLGRLAQHGNGVLDADEQRAFDAALRELRAGTASRVNDSLERARRGGPGNLDPALRRSYQRAQQRLAEHAERAQEAFPGLELEAPPAAVDPVPSPDPSEDQADDVSPATLDEEIEQTSDTLDLLERIASLQQQQLEHQESQLLSETRGLFFAFLVSVAVIVAGVAPLVDAEPRDRLLIVVWTVGVVAAAGLVYFLVRWAQRRR